MNESLKSALWQENVITIYIYLKASVHTPQKPCQIWNTYIKKQCLYIPRCNDSTEINKWDANHHWKPTQLINIWSENEEGSSVFLMCGIEPSPLSLSFLEASGGTVCSLSLLEAVHGDKENFIPEKGEACRQRGLHQARREAFEEASDTLIFGYLHRAVHQAPVTAHLHGRDMTQYKSDPKYVPQI